MFVFALIECESKLGRFYVGIIKVNPKFMPLREVLYVDGQERQQKQRTVIKYMIYTSLRAIAENFVIVFCAALLID